jgi:translation initiation factor IF-1
VSAGKRERGDERIRARGIVLETLPEPLYRVQLEHGREITAYASAKRSRLTSTISPGDRVRVELFSYDPRRGRIIRRTKRWVLNEPVRSFLKRLLSKETH